ncbi:histidine phosphatase family protein [Candidatus Uhrbacteria bacterium]|nr:histidine phosphatase family protein [Candidatus Uhrbacteria bacterium]
MSILCIRHGKTTGDIEDRYGGEYDDHLTPEGFKQAEKLADELKDKHIETLITSPMLRTCETAGVLREKNGTEITFEPCFKERNQYGILTGKIKSEAKAEYPDLVEKLNNRLNTIEGAESYEDFRDRVQQAFYRVVETYPSSCVAILWHGGPMRVLFRDILKKGELDKVIGDCAWVEIEKERDEFVIMDSRRIKFLF